jgi:hypothetical protein
MMHLYRITYYTGPCKVPGTMDLRAPTAEDALTMFRVWFADADCPENFERPIGEPMGIEIVETEAKVPSDAAMNLAEILERAQADADRVGFLRGLKWAKAFCSHEETRRFIADEIARFEAEAEAAREAAAT